MVVSRENRIVHLNYFQGLRIRNPTDEKREILWSQGNNLSPGCLTQCKKYLFSFPISFTLSYEISRGKYLLPFQGRVIRMEKLFGKVLGGEEFREIPDLNQASSVS